MPIHELGVEAPAGLRGRLLQLIAQVGGQPEEEAIDLSCHWAAVIFTNSRPDIKFSIDSCETCRGLPSIEQARAGSTPRP
jgi:hypothetical protein